MAEHSLLKSSFPVLIPQYHEVEIPETSKEPWKVSTANLEKPVPEEANFITAISDTSGSGEMFTSNGDRAYADSGDQFVNLFHQLEDSIEQGQIGKLLEDAWKIDSLLTLKIIWNARSIHLGKSSRPLFYRAIGWLATYHPRTLLNNLQWLVRPVICKKLPRTQNEKVEGEARTTEQNVEEDNDFEMIDDETALSDERPAEKIEVDEPQAEFDVKYGVSHGYWKDLLNILTLAANDQLNVHCNPHFAQNSPGLTTKKRTRDWTPGRKACRIREQHDKVTSKLEDDVFYQALHMAVAKLFADQLKLDLLRLKSGTKADRKRISMAAKWAPSNKGSHDENTFIVSTIAELLHPFDDCCPQHIDKTNRRLCLTYARIAYQSKTLSPLREHLDIVERHITAKSFESIKYDRVPSQALRTYTQLFTKKDELHFRQYLLDVANGKAKISGATLLPSTMVAASRQGSGTEIEREVANHQWQTLVQRIKDSGKMQSSIAVCDISGSMTSPMFKDRSRPIDVAIGLSLVLAEVCEPPFGGAFITFAAVPRVVKLDAGSTFHQKVRMVEKTDAGYDTNIVAVFNQLILPMAKKHKLTQDQMVKRVFVFSDMHFNDAQTSDSSWSGSYDAIKDSYQKAGYNVPELVFWNIAGSSTGTHHGAAPMPVQAAQEGTSMVSGYSQAMMKVFMEGGDFDKLEDEDAVEIDMDGEEVKKPKQHMTPRATVEKAVSHDAYRMLKVVD